MLIASAAVGTFHTLTLEAVSLIDAIRPSILAATWLIGSIALAAPLVRPVFLGRRFRLAWKGVRPEPTVALFLALLALLLIGLLFVAWIAVPNNVDSLLYHMARVVHWPQNESLRHYGTAYGHQLWNPPLAESVILSLRSLWGDDRPANLVQWSALVGVLIGVSGVARLLQLGRTGRMLAVAFAASVPMVVLQATSTQNDLATGFWLVAAAYFVLLDRQEPLGWLERAALGATFGLGLLTKGTFYVFGAVIGGWFIVTRPWRADPRRALVDVAWIAAAVVVLNLGHWSRNLAASGSPLGPADWVGAHGALTLDALKPRITAYLPRLLRALAPHLAGPWQPLNGAIDAGVKSVYRAFGIEVNAPIVVWAWNHEDNAGNPLHLLLIVVTLGGCAALLRARRAAALQLAGVTIVGFLLMVLLIPPAVATVGVRLQLPLFLLWSPVFAAVMVTGLPRRWALRGLVLLLLAAVPWLLFNTTRPLIGMRPEPGRLDIPCLRGLGCTRVSSILSESPVNVLFANVGELKRGYVGATQSLSSSTCREVGLRLDSSDPEYPVWYLLRAPQSGFRLETIYTTEELAPLLDRGFDPCAIVCTICGDRTRLHGLALSGRWDNVSLFQGDGFTWDEDG